MCAYFHMTSKECYVVLFTTLHCSLLKYLAVVIERGRIWVLTFLVVTLPGQAAYDYCLMRP